MDEKILPNDHPDYTKNLDRIMQLYTNMEGYVLAFNYCQEELTIRKICLRIAHTIMKIGDIIAGSDRRLNCYKQALTILEACVPPDNSAAIICLQVIGAINLEKRLLEETLQDFMKVLSIQEQTLSKSHPGIGWTLQQIGEVHFEMKNYPEALQFLTKCLKIYETNYSQSHDNIKEAQNSIDKVQNIIKQSNLECLSDATSVIDIINSIQVDNNSRYSDVMFGPSKIQEKDRKRFLNRFHCDRTRACCILQ